MTDNIIGKDWQGWPVYKMTFREVLESLGFKTGDGRVYIEDTNPVLDAFPITLEDDGMGYGINKKYVESSGGVYESDGENVFNLFIRPYDEDEVDEIRKEIKESEERVKKFVL